jgi:hypothetical protein
MPLSSAAPVLDVDIRETYISTRNRISGELYTETIEKLATDLGDAIHKYMSQAIVSTTDTTDAGQTDLPAAGTTTVTGNGTGTGTLS